MEVSGQNVSPAAYAAYTAPQYDALKNNLERKGTPLFVSSKKARASKGDVLNLANTVQEDVVRIDRNQVVLLARLKELTGQVQALREQLQTPMVLTRPLSGGPIQFNVDGDSWRPQQTHDDSHRNVAL